MRTSSIYKISTAQNENDENIFDIEIHYRQGKKFKTKIVKNMELHETRSFGSFFTKKETAPEPCRNCVFSSLKRFFNIA